MKFQILVPQYKETDSDIKPLLDSIAIQEHCDFSNDLSVIIVNDGSDVFLSDQFLTSYPFHIDYYKQPHLGVSAARQYACDMATAEYVMFCDADDMFYSPCAWHILSREMKSGFDSLTSVFLEETRDPKTKEVLYLNRQMDSTFVHGKVHRRQYLIDQNIKWNPNLTIHEDAYYNIQCQRLSSNVKYCPYPFYLWRWRNESVCRHDPKYILKTYNNMIEATDALVRLFIGRARIKDVRELVTHILYDAYFTMNKKEWLDQENQQYRESTERRFYKFYSEFKSYYDEIPEESKFQIVKGIKDRMYSEGLLMESITFDDWITGLERFNKEV